MQGKVKQLFHYPVKGLSAQPLNAVTLVPGQGFPLDRAFGFARPNSGFDPQNPKPIPKTRFVVLARDAALARLETTYDAATNILRIVSKNGSSDYDISTPTGRTAAAEHLADYLNYDAQDRPTLFSAAPHKFTDVSVVSPSMMNAISLVNIDSVAHFADQIDTAVTPERFRANILFDGIVPMAELNWVDREFRIGNAILRAALRTKRCPATEVNLDTGTRDINTPKLLRETFGHSDMGIYAEVVTGGQIKIGDSLVVD